MPEQVKPIRQTGTEKRGPLGISFGMHGVTLYRNNEERTLFLSYPELSRLFATYERRKRKYVRGLRGAANAE